MDFVLWTAVAVAVLAIVGFAITLWLAARGPGGDRQAPLTALMASCALAVVAIMLGAGSLLAELID
ncbi:MAG: hypothetical protein PS018_15075 [bacterium]|nr:hypothetical protein [bacterium]